MPHIMKANTRKEERNMKKMCPYLSSIKKSLIIHTNSFGGFLRSRLLLRSSRRVASCDEQSGWEIRAVRRLRAAQCDQARSGNSIGVPSAKRYCFEASCTGLLSATRCPCGAHHIRCTLNLGSNHGNAVIA